VIELGSWQILPESHRALEDFIVWRGESGTNNTPKRGWIRAVPQTGLTNLNPGGVE
jgi:hypothetical protein